MKRIFLLVWMLTALMSVRAIDPPQLRCLAVDATGAVTLTWLPSTNTAGFTRYEVYYSTDGNNFASVGQINNVATTTFVHTSADAVANARCFYYVTAVAGTETATSETLTTIEFYLTNGNGVAILNWDAPHAPALPTFSSDYDIVREYPANIWNIVGSAANQPYRDEIDVCEATIGYRVELADASGCRNVSRIQSDIFTDRTSPEIPQLDSVSVDFQTDRIRLGWERSGNEDVTAYIIYHLEDGLWVPIDTVYDIDNTSWTDTVNSADASQQYRIAALDSCLNSSPMSEPQHNFRATATYDLCRREAYISWDEYENLPPDIESYRIYFSENGSALQLAGEVPADVHNFTMQQLVPQSSYRVIVRALNLGGNITAASLKCSFTFNSADNNDFAYIRYVTVVDNAKIEIKVSTGTTVSFSQVHLYRSVGDDQHFVPFSSQYNNGTDTYVFEDENVQVDRTVYYYRATVENDCNVETYTSNVAHNILLTGESFRNSRDNNLQWSLYGDWAGGTDHYELYRKTEMRGAYVSVGGNMGATAYTDDVTELRREGEKFSYYVEAYESMDPYGFMETSRSNTVDLKQLPVTYIPNAFCPTRPTENNVFLPVNSFVTMENYHMYIYSREGNLLFHSNYPDMGWDGTYNGKILPMGCYVYKITYTYGSDGVYEAVGTVTLVR
ncbi:MAG: gliding motility-associated C-terminal domain-containing protein [Bacteroidales bacterium]|nr:gliding motility-associated C-terminal domain-containing protein [Bacteroidales bacterium]